MTLAPVEAQQPSITAAAAAGVEHQPARQIGGRDSGLDEERRLVFLGPGDVVAVPLPAEARDVTFAGKPGNAAIDGIKRAALRATKAGPGFLAEFRRRLRTRDSG